MKTKVAIQDTHKKVYMNVVNIIEKNPSNKGCLDQDYKPQFSVLPRTKDPQFRKPKPKGKQEWGIPISLFKDWKPYNDDILKKCFEFDWEHNKLAKFIKKDEDREKIKTFLKEHYRHYLECYKYYASIQPIGDVWAI